MRLLIVAMSVLIACGGKKPDAASALPADTDAAMVSATITQLAERVLPTIEKLPEGDGGVELLRSLTGVDLRSPPRCKESGIDPDRGLAIAWWKGAMIVVLPVSDDALASRRLGLRLARFGFEEKGISSDGLRSFENSQKLRATLLVKDGLARVCIGGEVCEKIDGTGLSLHEVRSELQSENADLIGVIRNRTVAYLIKVVAGKEVIPPLMRPMIGDMRFAVDLLNGLDIRLALGGTGDKWTFDTGNQRLPDDIAALVSIALPEALAETQLALYVVALCGSPCAASNQGTLDPVKTIAAWSGRAVVALSSSGTDSLPRLMASISMETAEGAKDLKTFLVNIAKSLGMFVIGSDMATDVTTAMLEGFEISLAVQADTVHIAAGRDSIKLVKDMVDGVHVLVNKKQLLYVAFAPSKTINAVYRIPVEFIRHMIEALKTVYINADLMDGRLMVQAGVELR